MKLTMNGEEVKAMFDNDKPSVTDVLNNKSIKQISKGFTITGVYKDSVNTNNINNYVIELEVLDDGD